MRTMQDLGGQSVREERGTGVYVTGRVCDGEGHDFSRTTSRNAGFGFSHCGSLCLDEGVQYDQPASGAEAPPALRSSGTTEVVRFPRGKDLAPFVVLVPRRGADRCHLISRPAVQQLHQCLVHSGTHGVTLAGARDVADMHFDS